MYSIGEFSKITGVSVSALRYYDKEGLFPGIQRSSGFRRFGESEREALRVIDCLKKSGMEIKDIKQFMDLTRQGPQTYKDRFEMIKKQKESFEKELVQMMKSMDMLKFKYWYYETAMKQGSEDNLSDTDNPDMPQEIKQAYINSHKEE